MVQEVGYPVRHTSGVPELVLVYSPFTLCLGQQCLVREDLVQETIHLLQYGISERLDILRSRWGKVGGYARDNRVFRSRSQISEHLIPRPAVDG
ncbi:MAG: hypothetical protein HY881_24020 [Deltaproteobacteria bacterium]|nr:hypothetical protein [Deltaproteobacteria bacterium]